VNVLGVYDGAGVVFGTVWLGANVRGVNVLGVYDGVGVVFGTVSPGANVRGVNVLGVYDGVCVVFGTVWLGVNVRGVNVLGVYDGVGVVFGTVSPGANVRGVTVLGVYDGGVAVSGVVELCGQVERENLGSGGGTVEVILGVGVIVTLGVASGVVKVRGIEPCGVMVLGVSDRGPTGAETPGEMGCCVATCGWNVVYGRVGPAAARSAPEPPGMALSCLSRSFRMASRRAVTAASILGVGEPCAALPRSNPWFVRGVDKAVSAFEVAPNAGLTTLADGPSPRPAGPELRPLSVSMYASRRCWSVSLKVAPVMALGAVPGVLPARPKAGVTRGDAPPVVNVRLPGLCMTVAPAEPVPLAVVSALRLRSAGPRSPSRERSVVRL